MEEIKKTSQYREQMDFKRQDSAMKNSMNNEKLKIEREKLATQRDIADKNLEIARENKNKYDVQSSKQNKNKE